MCLIKDEEELLTFYDFPAAHFQHVRTANPIESSFSTEKKRLQWCSSYHSRWKKGGANCEDSKRSRLCWKGSHTTMARERKMSSLNEFMKDTPGFAYSTQFDYNSNPPFSFYQTFEDNSIIIRRIGYLWINVGIFVSSTLNIGKNKVITH